MGDLIQGQAATPDEYLAQFEAAKIALDELDNIPYIPIIGNHDVWCNLTGDDIVFPSVYTIPPYDPGTPPHYPEQIFNDTFAGVY